MRLRRSRRGVTTRRFSTSRSSPSCHGQGFRSPKCGTVCRHSRIGSLPSMRRQRTCRRRPSGNGSRPATRLPGSCRPPYDNTSSGTDFTRQCQAGCMAKTEKRRRPHRLPAQIDRAVRAAEDKKALDLTLLDLRKAAGFTDYFLICSGTNPRQIRAIADSVMEALAAEGATPAHVEGYDRSEWVLLDYFDFIVH